MRSLRASLFMAIAGFSVFTSAMNAGASEPKTLLILDASGSMWGQIEGKSKIAIARDAVANLTKSVNASSSFGLMVYGHRRKGDCADIEVLIEPAANTGAAIEQAVKNIQPKGKTPLSQAVLQGAQALGYETNPVTIILVTDGIETCSLDPCEVAQTLEQKGVNFITHVIGFGLSPEEGKQVSCLADITGGRFLLPQNSAQLVESLQQTVKEAPPLVEIPTAEIIQPESWPTIGASFELHWRGPAGKQDYLDIVPTGYEPTHDELAYQWAKDGMPSKLAAPGKPGEYELRYVWQGPQKKHVLARQALTVEDAAVAVIGPASVGAGEVFSVEWRGPENKRDYIDLVPAGSKKTSGELSYSYLTANEATVTLQAPTQAGSFELRYIMQAPDGRQILARQPITVNAASATLAFNDMIDAGKPLDVYWTGPAAPQDYIDLVPEGHKNTSGETSYFYTKNSPEMGVLQVPAQSGNYQIRYILQSSDGRKVLATRAITVNAVNASLQAPQTAKAGSDILINFVGPKGNGDYIDLVPRGYAETSGELSYFYVKADADADQLRAPGEAGAYTIRYVLNGAGGKIVIATANIDIEAVTANLTIPVKAGAGESIQVAWTGPNNSGDYIDLVPLKYEDTYGELSYFYTNSSPESGLLTAPQVAGDYKVRYVMAASGARKVIASKQITVK